MLQKDGLFRRDRTQFAPPPPPPPSPAPTARETPPPHPEQKLPPRPVETRKEAKLVVGPDIKMKGVEVTDCDTLIVEGRIEATLDSRVIQIAEHGVFTGTVAVDEAEIHGRLEGELTVRKQLVVHGTGKVSGKIHYQRIKVEEGAELSGEINPIGGAQIAPRRVPLSA